MSSSELGFSAVRNPQSSAVSRIHAHNLRVNAACKGKNLDKAIVWWKTLHTDAGAKFDREVVIEASSIQPQVTWGTSPAMVLPISWRTR